jgi:hypothetical protein
MARLCVLTGDLIASSDLAPDEVDATLATIERAADDISHWQTPSLLTRFARRGGDGWQIAIGDPTLALRAALFIQARLRRDMDTTKTRIALATGDGTLPDSGDLNAAHGPVFVASGRLLTSISGNRLIAHAQGGAVDAATHLADHISAGWTQAQARAVAALLPPNAPARAEIAKSFGITRQAVNQALWSAGYPALDDALRAMEEDARK